MRPTQRFFNIQQLSMTPSDSFAIPTQVGKDNINVAAFTKPSTGQSTLHIVNNAASCTARITGLPAGTTTAVVRITNDKQHAEAFSLSVHNGSVDVDMPADSFVTILAQ